MVKIWRIWFLLVAGGNALLQAAPIETASANDRFWEWVGLIALAVVGVIILFVSSEQLKRLKRVYEQILEKEKKLEESQSKFLEDLGENIYETLQATTQSTSDVIQKARKILSETEIRKIVESEDRLMNTTQDLIFFLKLKSKRVEIVPGDFDFHYLMDNVIEALSKKYSIEGHRFDVRISESIPRVVHGDSLRLGQVLVNLLENALEEVEEPVDILISAVAEESKKGRPELRITIRDRNEANKHPAFQNVEPYYDDQHRKFVGLRIYVARELIELMGGKLEVKRIGDTHEIFLHVPVHMERSNLGIYAELPESCREPKNVLVMDRYAEEAEALKKGMEFYGYSVVLFDTRHCQDAIPDFERYDLAVLGKEMYQPMVREVLKLVRRKNSVRTVLLEDRQASIPERKDSLIDARLYRPFSQRDLYNLIVRLYGKEGETFHDHDETISVEAGPDFGEKDEQLQSLESSENFADEKKEEKPVKEDRRIPRKGRSLFIPPEKRGVYRESFSKFSGRLLLAEDNRISQEMFRKLLGKSKISLTIVSDGRQALEKIQNEEYDWVFLDNHMPYVDGEEVARRVRKDRRFDQLPLIIFTALPVEEKRVEFEEAGFDAYLPKPFKLSQLYSILDHSFQGEEEALERLDAFPILDERKGLSHANGQQELYAELLKEFLAVYSQSASLLRKYQREERIEEAKNLLLDIRGLAATIGAASLFAVVDPLFRRLREEDGTLTQEDVENYRRELERLKNAAERYLLEYHA